MDKDDVDNIFVKYVKEYQGMNSFCYSSWTEWVRSWLFILSDLNGNHVHVYPKPPTPLEFLRTSVHPNRPAIIKGIQSSNHCIHYRHGSDLVFNWKVHLNIGQQEQNGLTSIWGQKWENRKWQLQVVYVILK